MSDLHLSDADLVSLTGYTQPARQCAWLDERGWVFERPKRRGDRPRVARAYHDARMSGQPMPGNKRRGRIDTDWMQPTP